jgi:mannose-1-phosphate guanylyltransferase
MQENPDALFVVAPSDHIILQEEAFVEKMNLALEAAKKYDWLVTLGIQPTRPDTGYGYIQYTKDTVPDSSLNGIRKVKTFTEKPNLELARKFLESGDFLWNSGMFVWSLKSITTAFDQYLPEVSSVFREGIGKYGTEQEEEFIKGAYTMCKSISIDYGIMEKADNVYVLPSSFGWSDLGTWGSLHDNKEKDPQNNAVTGKDVMLYKSKNCVVHVPEGKLAVIQGLDGYIVVQDENTLLVCRLEDEQQLRQIVNDVKMEKGEGFV